MTSPSARTREAPLVDPAPGTETVPEVSLACGAFDTVLAPDAGGVKVDGLLL
jgi:hypothetical protein